MLRLVFVFVALILMAPQAEAASFDCAMASTSFENAICSNPDLSVEDEVLAQAYATTIGGLSRAALEVVKASQHDWLDYASRTCSDDARPIEVEYTDDQAQCLVSTFKSRVKSLEASRMLGGYRFYPFARFLIEQDEEATPADYVKVADKQFSTVKIDGDTDLANAFNAMTEEMRAGYTGLFLKGSDEIETGDTTEDITTTTAVSSVSDYRISLVTDNYSFGHGAAHGNYGITYNHFLVREQRPLYASDIFVGKDWKKVLGKLVLDKLNATIEGGVWEDAVKDVPGWSADPTRWDFSPEGLIVQFEPYEVSSYAQGAVTATIGWNDLRGIMASDAEAIATY